MALWYFATLNKYCETINHKYFVLLTGAFLRQKQLDAGLFLPEEKRLASKEVFQKFLNKKIVNN